jgi:hypothetical protein
MISPVKRGSIIELEAQILFTKAGFEVFTNTHADGPADLVVWDGSIFYPIDTKKLKRYIRADGSIGFSKAAKRDNQDNVYILGYTPEDGWIWISENIPPALDIL